MFIKLLLVTTCLGVSHAVTYPALTRQQYAELVAQQQAAPEHQQALEQPSQPQTISIIPKRHYKPVPERDDESGQAQYKQVLEQPVYYQQYQQPQAAVPQPQYTPQPQYQAAPAKASKYYKPQAQEPAQPAEEYDTNPQYQFGFDIHDDENTNYHNRKEQRDGDKITGSYSVVDSDGFIRTVTYTADPKEGFKAEVSREPTDIKVKIPTPAPAAAPQYKLAPAARPAPPQYRKPAPVQYAERPEHEEPAARPQYIAVPQPSAVPAYPAPSQYRLVGAKSYPYQPTQHQAPLFQQAQYEQ